IFGANYAAPVDGNTRFIDGWPLVGPSKTIRGIAVSLVVTALDSLLLDLHFWIGFLLAATSMAGDLFSSFFKSGLYIERSSKGTGLNRLPECLFPLRSGQPVRPLTAFDSAVG